MLKIKDCYISKEFNYYRFINFIMYNTVKIFKTCMGMINAFHKEKVE